jgi:hypothetical protein
VLNEGDGLCGLDYVPMTHDAIFNHSRLGPHVRYVWISKVSTVDDKGNLGHPASREEIRKFGDKARMVFLHKPPSVLLKSFVKAAMSWEYERQAKRPWAAWGGEERASPPDRRVEDRDPRANHQEGMGALVGRARQQGEDCGVLVGRRTCEGPPNKLRSQPAMRVVEIFAKFKGDRGMSRKANTWYIPLLNLLSSGIG